MKTRNIVTNNRSKKWKSLKQERKEYEDAVAASYSDGPSKAIDIKPEIDTQELRRKWIAARSKELCPCGCNNLLLERKQ
jgi:hypothetical protein